MNSMELLNYEHILDQIPGICFIKDLHLDYAWINQGGINATRLGNREAIIGKSDYQMPWQFLANKFIEQDILSLQGKTQFTIEENPPDQKGDISLALLKKSPFFSKQNNIQGVMCVGFEISRACYKDIFSLFMASNLQFKDFARIPDINKRDFLYGELKFSKRQAQLISYLLKGHSKKSIGKYLNLSPRTIEFYLNNIKDKLGCTNKTDIVDKAFELGFIDLMFWKEEGSF